MSKLKLVTWCGDYKELPDALEKYDVLYMLVDGEVAQEAERGEAVVVVIRDGSIIYGDGEILTYVFVYDEELKKTIEKLHLKIKKISADGEEDKSDDEDLEIVPDGQEVKEDIDAPLCCDTFMKFLNNEEYICHICGYIRKKKEKVIQGAAASATSPESPKIPFCCSRPMLVVKDVGYACPTCGKEEKTETKKTFIMT